MSTLAWIIIGVLVLIIVVLAVIAFALINFAHGMLSSIIVGCGGPDISKKRKR